MKTDGKMQYEKALRSISNADVRHATRAVVAASREIAKHTEALPRLYNALLKVSAKDRIAENKRVQTGLALGLALETGSKDDKGNWLGAYATVAQAMSYVSSLVKYSVEGYVYTVTSFTELREAYTDYLKSKPGKKSKKGKKAAKKANAKSEISKVLKPFVADNCCDGFLSALGKYLGKASKEDVQTMVAKLTSLVLAGNDTSHGRADTIANASRMQHGANA